MEVARTSAERAAALTHRLLAFARRQELKPDFIDAPQDHRPADIDRFEQDMAAFDDVL